MRTERTVAREGHARFGVTLVELLVVLVIMAIAAALVVPALRFPAASVTSGATGSDAESGLLAPSPIDAVVTSARRLAVKRGQPLRLRVAPDGVWAIVAETGGPALSDGRLPDAPGWVPDLRIDALGRCVIASGTRAPGGVHAWDSLACRWRTVPA